MPSNVNLVNAIKSINQATWIQQTQWIGSLGNQTDLDTFEKTIEA